MADQKSQSVDALEVQTTNRLAHHLNLLLSELLSASRATTDAVKLMQLNTEMAAIQTLINQAAQAQAAANDILFSQATAGLKAQANMLTDMEAQISQVVADVASAGRILGYITQAVALIAKL